MRTSYEEVDCDLAKLINLFREEIIREDASKKIVRKKDFFYDGMEYLLVSVLPNYPYMQILAQYGEGKKIEKAYIIIANYYFSINKKIINREINNIRKYNGYQLSSRCIVVPQYVSSFPEEIIMEIKSLLDFVYMRGNELLQKTHPIKEKVYQYKTFCDYIKYCNYIETKREEPKIATKCAKIC